MSMPEETARELLELELALLRHGVDERVAARERCSRCARTPLVGEHVYEYGGESLVCELCRVLEPGPPLRVRLVHGPAYGHTIRILDQRAA